MPVSGFPNQLAYVLFLFPCRFVARAHGTCVGSSRAAQEDDLGQVYLTNVDFLKNGIPASIIAALVRAPSCARVVSGIREMADEGEQVVSTVGYLLMMVIG